MPVVGALFLPVTAWLVHLAALWLWHLPMAFEAAHDVAACCTASSTRASC